MPRSRNLSQQGGLAKRGPTSRAKRASRVVKGGLRFANPAYYHVKRLEGVRPSTDYARR